MESAGLVLDALGRVRDMVRDALILALVLLSDLLFLI